MEQEKQRDPEDGPRTYTATDSFTHRTDRTNRVLSKLHSIASGADSGDNEKFSAWATIISVFLLQFTGFGYASSFGVFQDFYVRDYLTDSSSSQIRHDWIGSTQSFMMLGMGIFSGRLFDKGYCYHLIISGSVIHILSLFMLSLARPERYYQVFLTQGLGVGIGAGLAYAPSIAVLAQHFPTPTARTRAMGVAASGVSLGGVVLPILLNEFLHKGNGGNGHRAFRRGTRASAGLVTGLTIIAILLLRTKYPRKNATSETKEAGGTDIPVTKPANVKDLISKFATDWAYVCFVIGMTLYEVVFLFPLFYLQLYAIKHGLNSDFAFYSISILNSVSFAGRLVPGFFVRSLGIANMLLFSTGSTTVLMFCMLSLRTIPSVAVFASFYGFFSGAFISLMNPMLALLAENPSEIGARMGMCFAITAFGSLTGTPIAGALLTSRFIWWRPIIFSGCVCVVGVLLFTASRIILGRRRGSLWVI